MKTEFIAYDYDYFDIEGKNYVKIIGRNLQGKRICLIDDYEANFWAILKDNLQEKDIEKVRKKIEEIEVDNTRKTKVIKTEIVEKNFLGRKVKAIKVFIENHKDGHAIADQMDFPEIEKRREYDLSLISKYIMEKKLNPLTWYEISGDLIARDEFGGISDNLEVDFCLKLNDFKETSEKPIKPRILAYDIETDEFEIGKGNVLMISLYGENFKKVLTWKKCSKSQDFVECFKDEEKMLEAFVKNVKDYSPDLLVGYFSDGFDLPYLKAVADKNKFKLNLGLDNSQPKFSRGRITTGKINGIVHVDLFRFIESVFSQYLQSETLSLNDVASELLGEEKHDFDFTKLKSMKDENWKEFFEYNLQDSRLTYKLSEKIWIDLLEFTKIMKEPLFSVTRNSMSAHVEDYLLHNLERFNEIAEKRPIHDEISKRRDFGKYEGAFVFQPIPGLYNDLCVFDFTSMHASIIVSFNLSLSTLLDKKERNCYETPEFLLDGKQEKFYFSKEKGFFPVLLNEVVELRKKYKKEYNANKSSLTKARSNAYKLLANASYGYQGFFGARYYCREAAASTLSFVRDYTNKSIEIIKNKGHKIIFSDTDSIGFTIENKNKEEIIKMLEEINKNLPGIMELELEDFYSRGLFVSKRTTKTKKQEQAQGGAKKKYALIDEKGKLKIRGFETVRRDWCKLARELQNQVLNSVLKDGNEKKALEIIKQTIENIKKRKINKKDILIRTQLKKPINEYLSISPHVTAAKKMEEQGIPVSQGMLIEYFIAETREKKALVREKVKLPDEKGEYNIDYYLNNQILPAVENIIEVFNVNIKEVIDGERQKKLFSF